MSHFLLSVALTLGACSVFANDIVCANTLLFEGKYVYSISEFKALRGKRGVVGLYPVSPQELRSLLESGVLPSRRLEDLPQDLREHFSNQQKPSTTSYGPLYKYRLDQKTLLEMGGVPRRDSVHGMGKQKERNDDLKSGYHAAETAAFLANSLPYSDRNHGYWWSEGTSAIVAITSAPFQQAEARAESIDKWWDDDSMVGNDLILSVGQPIGWEGIGAVFATNPARKILGLPEKTKQDYERSHQ